MPAIKDPDEFHFYTIFESFGPCPSSGSLLGPAWTRRCKIQDLIKKWPPPPAVSDAFSLTLLVPSEENRVAPFCETAPKKPRLIGAFH